MAPAEILQSVSGCLHDISLSYGLPLSLFLAGLVGGMTHCVAMCGPFVLSQTGKVEKIGQAFLLPYHLGRLTTYTILAVLLGSVLNAAFLFLPVRTLIVVPILCLAGILFIVSAFPSLMRLFPWATRLGGRALIPYQSMARSVAFLSQNPSGIKKFLMGIILGFMPCGLVLSALMAASTAENGLSAGLAMAAFGVGTMPALMATGLGGGFLKTKFPVTMQRVTQVFMVWSGLWLFALAGMMLMS
ncbi:MAG: sulfite exporter TauE/SafE family protein [Rhodospirillales bacterium]|nr:sulfite exporter TauE/SafE family protein [Rhodospirillales bacterium]MCB9980575.1 sulfite exporter TauE/SafE family protein [Rhodospirillales bacterium]